MKIYTLRSKQQLPISLDEAWKFLSDPANLKVITPDYMSFDILSGADRPMFEGQIIQYIVTPIAGIKTKWVTEITHVRDREFFVDEQRFGPYSLWHHKHFLKEIDGGVEMEDVVDYKLPMGFLGTMAHPFLVKPKLKEIFDYRQEKLVELFGEFGASQEPDTEISEKKQRP
ncbi:SRPBCC family protein [Autumnicola edwardsiae]|uniref:SRPBCC family protein n=1 Tax=Autumnicola edwardsiae TaxID=3075594 RepID=A0ABU3CUH6_9FLAO|nr:SRPBCC family protein [Zunongwangia sp. F297]MDT0650017.1 SRPBCC family protein [Zunongwangia sp. F297]